MKRFVAGFLVALAMVTFVGWRPGSPGSDDFQSFRIGTFVLDPPNVLASLSADATVTVSGLDVASNWNLNVQPMGAMAAGLSVGNAWLSSDNTVTVRFANTSILAINQTSLTFSYVAFK